MIRAAFIQPLSFIHVFISMIRSLLRLAACAALVTTARGADSLAALRGSFAAPPAEARPMVRWWWFGPAVVKPQLEREMQLMHEGGFGGFEVQPTYPLALDEQYPGLKNVKFLSPEFFDLLRFSAGKAKEIGLRMDLTLGSGWPFGGPMFSREEAPQSIRDAGTVTIAAGQSSVAAPNHDRFPGAPVIAALLGPIPGENGRPGTYLPLPVKDRSAALPADLRGATQVRFFGYAPANLMQVKRAAYGAEGFIVDHYSPAAIEKFIREIAEPEIAACGDAAPYTIFCDSLEIVGEGWTPNFPAEFQRRRGYDLIPLLPALFDATLPDAAKIRGDYGRTVAELFDDVFVDRFTKLAHDHRTRFRLQAYGTPPTTLMTYARIDVGEGENYNWRAFSGTRWAASANHLLGRAVTSSEAFTWLHSPVFMAAPIDIKAESNLQFLNGVNHLLYHGWPYTAPGVEYPGWRFYAAAVFNEKNPWWLVMPDINRYLARTSFLLRQGTPANDIALYLPEEDAFAAMTPSSLQMVGAGGNGILNRLVNAVVPHILDAGFNFDGIDAGILAARGKVSGGALAFGDVKYRVVVLPNLTRIAPAALRTLEAFANDGGILLAVGQAPSEAPGYQTSEADRAAVRSLSAKLFTGPNAQGLVVAVDELAKTLAQKLRPDVTFARPSPQLGFVHRRTADADIYFVANTGAEAIATEAEFRRHGGRVEIWNADTGKIVPVQAAAPQGEMTRLALELPPFGAQFVVFSAGTARNDRPSAASAKLPAPLDLSADWDVSFQNAAPEPNPPSAHYATLKSWTEDTSTHFFSGVATYRKRVEVPATMLAAGVSAVLDFGPGEPTTVAGGAMGMRANFQPPIGDAAVIYVNGARAGSLWCPPYRLDITTHLHAGTNELRIEVANRAVNYLADTAHHPLPDYAALNANRTYGGNRFQPQDMNRIEIVPSGILRQIRLVGRAPE